MRELVKAGALIAAEIDRLQRLRPNNKLTGARMGVRVELAVRRVGEKQGERR